MTDSLHTIIGKALHENQDRFVAVALAEVPSGDILFLHADAALPEDFADALAALAKRAATFTENHDRFDPLDEVLFYDLEDRQIILNLIQRQPASQILVVVAAPQKAYKQASKRLAKALQTA
jgi:hypothetical protein